MTYELAKQLWDRGYPFNHRDGDLKFMCACTKDVCDGPWGREFRFEGNLYPEPTLDELIDACGDEFKYLYLAVKGEDKRWSALSDSNPLREHMEKTRLEAVAKLWIDLHPIEITEDDQKVWN